MNEDLSNDRFVDEYKTVLSKYLTDNENIGKTLSSLDHQMWEDLTTLLTEASDDNVQYLLNRVHEERFSYAVPEEICGVTVLRRTSPKNVNRLRRKMSQRYKGKANRSAFIDWIACRIEGHFDKFDEYKQELSESLPSEAVFVWRFDYEVNPDILQTCYVYQPQRLAIMEVQVVEPIAAWVFTSNSKNKHEGNTSCVTFKESKELYDSVKTAILENGKKRTKPSIVDMQLADVAKFYENERKKNASDDEIIPVESHDLVELQSLVNDRFAFVKMTAQRKDIECFATQEKRPRI